MSKPTCNICARDLHAPGTCAKCMVALSTGQEMYKDQVNGVPVYRRVSERVGHAEKVTEEILVDHLTRAKVPDWEIKFGITEDGVRYMAGIGQKEGEPPLEPVSITLNNGWIFLPGGSMKYSGSLEGIAKLSEQAAVEAGLDVKAPDPLTSLQDEIAAWADEHYPDRTYHNAMTKLVMEEIPEILRRPSDPMEWADAFILLLDAAKLQGVDIAKAVREKMEINRRRTWAVDPNTGVMHHVRGTWVPLTASGQVGPGHWVRFDLGKEKILAKVVEVLNPGTASEEVIYDAERNHYFITAKVVLGTSSAKNVEVLRDGK